jgi:dienelactone hydrolase
LLAFVLLIANAARAGEPDDRQAELQRLLSLFPRSEPWEEWLKKTGELPPDFSKLPSIAGLPDPLVLEVGGKEVPVRSPEEWRARRAKLLDLFHYYILGTVPPPPENVRPKIVRSWKEEGATAQEVELEFGPGYRAKLGLEVLVPAGKGPFPVFLTQHNHRAWALVALSRGYVACVYNGADSKDDTAGFLDVWPEHDWTKLARRAYAASRAIDYLSTLSAVDPSKIGMTGHSRNGKMSLMASAMDERIAAVISSSSGAGGSNPCRFFSEAQFGEGIELITRNFPDWLHPRLRFFAGRENKLPIDFHELIALSAPRSCLLSTALNDSVESTWAIEEAYRSAKRVYDLLGHPERISMYWRYGTHGTRAEVIETYLDWLDVQFGRSGSPGSRPLFPERFFQPRFEAWARTSGEMVDPAVFPRKGIDDLLLKENGEPVRSTEDWVAKKDDIRKRIVSILGEGPPSALNPGGDYGSEERYLATLLGRPSAASGMEKKSLNFGNYLSGDLYSPEGAAKKPEKLPAVVWLHPHSYSNGYVAGYRRGEHVHITLARDGFVVLAYDQIGFGTRIEEAEKFYERHPHWSLLGKMVADARSAVDVLLKQPWVDPDRVFVLGYSLGGSVALHAAALDERIAGVVSVAGFTPMRLDTASKGTGGIARYSQWHALLPRLGFFVGQEERVPYDYHEVLGLIAPRPVLAVAPRGDIEATFADVMAALDRVEKVYTLLGAPGKLLRFTPDDYNRYSPELQAEVNQRLKAMAGK